MSSAATSPRKDWLTAREIAELKLPGMPDTERGMQYCADREGWNDHPAWCRDRKGRGGGREYHINLLPIAARIAYDQRFLKIAPSAAPDARAPAPPTASATAHDEHAARMAIVTAYDTYGPKSWKEVERMRRFIEAYNSGALAADPWVRAHVRQITMRSLHRWRSKARDGQSLGFDRAEAKKGRTVLGTANGGRVNTFMLALIAQNSLLSAHQIRSQLRAEFGDQLIDAKGRTVDVPPVRTIQDHIARLKADQNVALTALSNPDQYRSHMAPRGRNTYAWAKDASTLWMIDASPVDALCTDGRHSIYACIDIATRRLILYVNKTPRSAAVQLLIRKAVRAWGVPKVIKTDNGSDFVAISTQKLFAALGIEMDRSDAYSPTQKAHVERVIKTFQHDCATLLDGFIGHNVAQRKAIEDRKSFADRLGTETADLFGVRLTGAELQIKVDEWVNLKYDRHVHSALGMTPLAAAAKSTAPVMRVDERALDILLMPIHGKDGVRTVTHSGIRIDHYNYVINEALPGDRVLVRMDPMDAGKAYAFDVDCGAFVGAAVSPELSGKDPVAIHAAKKQAQKDIIDRATQEAKAEIKKLTKGRSLLDRDLDVARRDLAAEQATAANMVALPKRSIEYTTPAIEAAKDAAGTRKAEPRPVDPKIAKEQARLERIMEEERLREEGRRLAWRMDELVEEKEAEFEAARIAPFINQENIVPLPETPKERFRRAWQIEQSGNRGEPCTDTIAAMWAGRYQNTPEYKAHRALLDEYPDYLDQ